MIRENFLRFLNKKKFDYSTAEVNPYKFHITFYFLVKIFRVLNDEALPKWTFVVPAVVCFNGFMAMILFGGKLKERIVDFKLIEITEAATYFILMVYKLVLVSCPILERVHYHRFLKAMRDDFKYICTKGLKYRKRYLELQLFTWKATILCTIFVVVIGFGMVFFACLPLIFYLVFRPKDGVRPLPYPLWVGGLDTSKSPLFECIFIFSIWTTITHCVMYIFNLQTQIVWIRQIMSKADLVIWSLEDLLLDIEPTFDEQEKLHNNRIIQNRLSEIVSTHQAMLEMLEGYSTVYRKVLMFEQKLCAPAVCLTAFCAGEKLKMGQLPAFELMICVSVVILSGIPSYACTILSEKVESIGEACWSIPFWKAARQTRPYLVLMMQRSRRPLPLQAAGFASVSLETYSKNLTTAYSWFNMLRQANIDIKN